jgi:hypothetical protein
MPPGESVLETVVESTQVNSGSGRGHGRRGDDRTYLRVEASYIGNRENPHLPLLYVRASGGPEDTAFTAIPAGGQSPVRDGPDKAPISRVAAPTLYFILSSLSTSTGDKSQSIPWHDPRCRARGARPSRYVRISRKTFE